MNKAPERYTVEIMVTKVDANGEAYDTVSHIGPAFAHMDEVEVKAIAQRLEDAAIGLFEHLEGATPLCIAPEEETDPEFAVILAELELINKALEAEGIDDRHHVSKIGSDQYQLWGREGEYGNGKKIGLQRSAKGMIKTLRLIKIHCDI